MVVEDDKHVLSLICSLLQSNNYDVMSAVNGSDALEQIAQKKPDLIISDVMMPELDGFGLIRQLQQNQQTKTIPILFLTAKNELKSRVEGLSLGADDYICKPFAIEELLARVEMRLKKFDSLVQMRPQEEGEMHGDLQVLPIVDLIQILRMGKKTGTIELHYPAKNAVLRLNDGEIVDIEYGDFSGMRAFRLILQENIGFFEFTISTEKYDIKCTIDTQELIMEGAKQIDHLKQLLSELPALDRKFKVSDIQFTEPLCTETMDIIYLFDGQRTLEEIIMLSPYDEEESARAIEDLLQKGLIEENISTMSPVNERFVFQSLEEEDCRNLKPFLKKHPGITSIPIISLDELDLGPFINTLCPADASQAAHSMKKKKMTFRKHYFEGKHEINIYGLKGHQQFTFFYHILGQDILGLLLIAGQKESFSDPEIISFTQEVQKEYELPFLPLLLSSRKPSEKVFLGNHEVLWTSEKFDPVMRAFQKFIHIIKTHNSETDDEDHTDDR